MLQIYGKPYQFNFSTMEFRSFSMYYRHFEGDGLENL